MKPIRLFYREMLSENGNGSAKRLFGGIALLTSLGCIIYLTVTEGCSSCVENILQTIIITSCALLGVSSVTRIWTNKNLKENE